jgi:fatty acyl-CoA reductase
VKGLRTPFSGSFSCRAIKDAIDSLKYTTVVNYFGVNGWMYQDTNVRSLLAKLTPADRDTFSFDIKELNWNEYLESCVKGVRQYILKDDPSTLPQARKRYETYVHKQKIILPL